MHYRVTFDDSSPHFAHHGVMGMHWGVRSEESLARERRGFVDEYGRMHIDTLDRSTTQLGKETVLQMTGNSSSSKTGFDVNSKTAKLRAGFGNTSDWKQKLKENNEKAEQYMMDTYGTTDIEEAKRIYRERNS